MVLFFLNLFKSFNSQGYVLCFDWSGLLLLIHIIQLATEVFAPKCCFYFLKVWIPLLLFLCTIHFSVESYALTDTELSHLGRLSNLQYLQLAGLPGTWYKSTYRQEETPSLIPYIVYTLYIQNLLHIPLTYGMRHQVCSFVETEFITHTLSKKVFIFF